MQGLFRRAVASVAALVLLAPTAGDVSFASSPHRALSKVTVALATPPQRIPVKEPVRVEPSPPPADAMRPKTVPGVRAHGVHVAGPPMLRPTEIDRVLSAARRRALQETPPKAPPGSARAVPQPSLGTHPGMRRAMALPSDPNASGTGINPWWRYQEENVPGGGHVMVNVGTGNLLLQDDDMAVPHKGIALAFRRTYNSQSRHDVNADDAAGYFWKPPGLYGNGWTNTFDAHLARNADGTLFSVFDIDGARYDFVNGVPGPGNHTTLVGDGVCGFLWTKKSGTTYYFYRPTPPGTCGWLNGPTGGYAGRLYQIIGRNRNTFITFSYAWDNGDASSTGKISQITATTESGMSATLSFADYNGHRLLQQLTMPDGTTTVSYGYDSLGNLIWVYRPSNNAAGTQPQQTYGYTSIGSDSILQWAASPRWQMLREGGYLTFAFAGSGAVSSTLTTIGHVGVMNWAPPDGTNAVLQPGVATGAFQFLTEYFTTGVTTPTFRDSDGHMTNWIVDGTGRPTQTQECTASMSQGQQCTGMWLVTNESWDAQNNLISTIDARGYETDYAYDAMGNTIAVADPADVAGGTRPTRLFSYDGFNNLTYYCDQTATAQQGLNWTTVPASSDSLCPQSTYATQYARDYPTYQPYGRLLSRTTPRTASSTVGYAESYAYASTQSGATDFGLPVSVTGTSFSEERVPVGAGAVTITPQQTFSYDTNGNLICYSKGSGTWSLTYDALGRPLTVADPDDASSGGVCGRVPGLPGSTIKTTYTYYADGSKSSTQTPSEAVAGVSTTFLYDMDGDETSETHHYGGSAGVTTNWYDGADRLVETSLPHDPTDYYPFPWETRYLYDLTQGGSVSIAASQSYNAYGGLYKTQEFMTSAYSGLPTGWIDLKGTATDALGRITAAYKYSPGNGLVNSTKTYDGAGDLGLLTSEQNAAGDVSTYTYTDRDLLLQKSFSGSITPTRTYSYDLNGRVVNINSSMFGDDRRQYDFAGELISRSEPTGGGITDPVTLTYNYLPNGWKSSVDISGETGAVAGFGSSAKRYEYRTDGALLGEGYTYNGSYYPFTTSLTAAGREQSSSDPYVSGSHQFSFDNTGRPLTYTSPGFAFTQMAYDPEGELKSFNGYGTTVTNSYTVRGELIAQEFGSDTCNGLNLPGPSPAAWFRDQNANGIMVPTPFCNATGSQFDPLSGAITISNAQDQNYDRTTTNYSFDAEGRENGVSSTTSARGASDSGSSSVRTNDAEDRVAEVDYSAFDTNGDSYFSAVYRWGPNGHPAMIGHNASSMTGPPTANPYQSQTLHWDGDSLLFVSDSAGRVNSVELDILATYWPHGLANGKGAGYLAVYDYDSAGGIVNIRNSAQPGIGQPPSAYQFAPTGFGATATFDILPASNESITDDYQTIQGVRTLENGAQQWSSPDAFAGKVGDPMSQKPYMWNRNNPYSYSDPSGYDVIVMVDPNSVQPFGHSSMVIYNPHTMVGFRYDFGPKQVGSVAGAPAKVSIEEIPDVRKLGAYNQYTYHFDSTAAQDTVMRTFWHALDAAAKAGSKYNAFDNNCDLAIKAALTVGQQDASAITGWPSETGELLRLQGRLVNPQDLRPRPEY